MGEVSVLRPPSFLHSPWLEELLALQSRVSQQTNNRQAKEHARAMKRRIRLEHRAGSNGSQSDAQVGSSSPPPPPSRPFLTIGSNARRCRLSSLQSGPLLQLSKLTIRCFSIFLQLCILVTGEASVE